MESMSQWINGKHETRLAPFRSHPRTSLHVPFRSHPRTSLQVPFRSHPRTSAGALQKPLTDFSAGALLKPSTHYSAMDDSRRSPTPLLPAVANMNGRTEQNENEQRGYFERF